MKYKISQYAKIHNVTNRTVWNWIYDGKLTTERTKTNRVLIVEEGLRIIGSSSPEFTLVDYSTVDDKTLKMSLKSSNRLKQEKNVFH